MQRPKYFLLGSLAIVILLISVASASAQNQNSIGPALGNEKIAQAFNSGKFLSDLNLTSDQIAQIKSIFQQYAAQVQTQIQNAIQSMMAGNLDMTNGIPNLVNQMPNVQLLFEQLKSVLTPDQLAKIQAKQQQIMQQMQQFQSQLMGRLGV
jgi:Spy/CpxP family protein refolding chaperone